MEGTSQAQADSSQKRAKSRHPAPDRAFNIHKGEAFQGFRLVLDLDAHAQNVAFLKVLYVLGKIVQNLTKAIVPRIVDSRTMGFHVADSKAHACPGPKPAGREAWAPTL